MTETVWISEAAAAKILRESDWGRLHSPYVSYTVSIFDDLTRSISSAATKTTVHHGMSDKDKALLRFNIFIKKILNSFALNNSGSVRDIEGAWEFSEESVRNLGESLLDDDIRDEFGGIPDTKF